MRQEFWRLMRFGLVGAASALTFYVIAVLLTFVDVPAVIASATAYAVAVGLNFMGHKYVTFRSDAPAVGEAARFLTISVPFGLAIAFTLTWVGSSVLRLPNTVTFALVVVMLPLGTYWVARLWVFRPTQHLHRDDLAHHRTDPSQAGPTTAAQNVRS